MLHKIVETAGLVKSFAVAAHILQLVGEFSISDRHVNRLTQEIGAELQLVRDQRTEDYVHHRRQPPATPAPDKVAVAVDGGRVHTREPGHGVGVHEAGWREDKVACLQTLKGPSFTEDPHPEPPQCFLDKEYVKDMVKDFQQQKGLRSYDEPEEEACEGPSTAPVLPATVAVTPQLPEPELPEPKLPEPELPEPELPEPELSRPESASEPPTTAAATVPPATDKEREWPPERENRTCVASLAKSRDFGKMLAAEVHARGFQEALERAFLGDGLAYNWKIQECWLRDFTPILDFIHPLSYLYASAGVLSSHEGERWSRYERWMRWCWQGRVSEVLAELRTEQAKLHQRLGEPEGKMAATDPREVVRRTLGYLGNNVSRMEYPKYRQRGLPVTSTAVESLIKEFNYRVKGTERFWNRPEGVEAILQVRAAVLSEDGRLEKYILSRPGQAHRGKRSRADNKKKVA